MLKRRRVLAAKAEAVSGTLESLASADVIYGAYDVMIQPNIAFDQREGDGTFSQDQGTLNARGGTATFKTELRGDGSGDVPQWAEILLPACGWVDDETGVFSPKTASPGSNGVTTLTIATFQDLSLIHI